jgi:hypothetical protein
LRSRRPFLAGPFLSFFIGAVRFETSSLLDRRHVLDSDRRRLVFGDVAVFQGPSEERVFVRNHVFHLLSEARGNFVGVEAQLFFFTLAALLILSCFPALLDHERCLNRSELHRPLKLHIFPVDALYTCGNRLLQGLHELLVRF